MFTFCSLPKQPAMDIPAAIDLNKTFLARIIAGLFTLLGGGAGPARISVELHRRIVRVLRPAESAVRRLIVVLVTITGMKAPPPRAQRRSSVPPGLARTGDAKKRQSFALFDPRQRFWRQRPAKKTPRALPRIISLTDEGLRRLKESLNAPPVPDKKAEDVSPINLLRRLEAVVGALNDLPHQAKRLVRALARRQNVPKLKFRTPLRPGRPPGHRQKPRLEIDHVLRECEWLARNALPPAPDTS